MIVEKKMKLREFEKQYITDENDKTTHVILKNKDYRDLFYVASVLVGLLNDTSEETPLWEGLVKGLMHACLLQGEPNKMPKIMPNWCMCEKIGPVARNMHSTCGQCGGQDAYGSSPDRPLNKMKLTITSRGMEKKK